MPSDTPVSHQGSRPGFLAQMSFGPGERWAFVSSFSYALYNFASRVAVLAADPLVAPVFRMVPTVAYAWSQSRRNWSQMRISSADFMGWRVLLVLILSGIMTSLGNIAFFYALERGGIVLTAPVLATMILWNAAFAAIFLKEPLAPRMIVGVVIAALGVGLLSFGRVVGGEVSSDALSVVLLSLLAAACWAATTNCQRYALKKSVDTHVTIATGQTWGVLALVVLLFSIGRGALLWTTDVETVGLFLVVGVLGTMAIVSLTVALSHTTVVSVSTIGSTHSLLAMILAVLFLGEKLNWLTVIGTLLTILGVVFFQLARVRDPSLE